MTKLGTLWQIGRTFGARDGLLRLGYEAQRASGVMSRRMQAVGGWQSWDLSRIAPKTSSDDFLSGRRQGNHPFFFSNARSLSVELKKILRAEGEQALIAKANRILEGNLPFFGRLTYHCGFPPNWFENPVTSQRVTPANPWTKMRFASRANSNSKPNADNYGDLKFILEPSRFLFIYPLARAYALTGDARFPEAFWQALESWHASSPPMSGPLWICGQESSLRIMAWSFAFHAFLHSSTTTPQRAAKLLSMIAAHAWRTVQTIGYARSQRSNHLVSEAVGLWTAGTLYPELKEAQAWQKQGVQLLREAVRDQITPEGAYLQDSFNYQRMVLHQLLWTIRLAEIHTIELDPEIRERTTAALNFVEEFVDAESGHIPNHGSNDGSEILPLSSCDYGDFRPLLRMASSVLNLPNRLEPGPWDEAALWLCNNTKESETKSPAHSDSSSIAAGQDLSSKKKPRNESGYHRLGTRNAWAFVRAGHYKRRPFQADQLHMDLWWHGLNLARDAGTYLYNGDPPWDNGLASTAVHNTVTVDRRDQMHRAGRFLWLDWAQTSGKSFSTKNSTFPNCFEGEHDGYRRLGVNHKRTVQCVTEDAWFVVDDLQGGTEHHLRLHWLLPDLPLNVMTESPFCASLTTASARFRWHIFSSAPGSAAVIRGGKSVSGNVEEAKLLGWESPTYGELCPAISLLYRIQARLPVRIITVILADEDFEIRQSEREVILSRQASELYKVDLAPPQAVRR